MTKPIVKSFFDPATNTITHIAYDQASKEAVILDPVLGYCKLRGGQIRLWQTSS